MKKFSLRGLESGNEYFIDEDFHVFMSDVVENVSASPR